VPSERLRLEMYKRLAEVREDEDVDLLREEMRDRYGEPPAPVDRLLAVARFRGRCRRARVAEVGVQGKYVRFAPVELPESRVVRLNRVHPGSLVKAGMRTMLVPRPQPATFGAQPLRDDELLAWAGRVIDDIVDPPQSKTAQQTQEKQAQKQESAS